MSAIDWDDAYANAPYIDGADDYPPRWAREAAAFRANLGDRAQLDRPYGSGARETYDLFMPESPAKGTLVFVHGGYWRAFDKSSWSYLAAGPMAHGWAVAMPSYDLCPAIDISGITRQVAAALRTIADATEGAMALAGHSAGGHLVARMIDRALVRPDIAARLRAVIPISPLSDLRPLLRTKMNEDFRLDATSAEAESPIFMSDRHDVPVTVWVGADERPAFVDQAKWLASAWSVDLVVAEGRHHFDAVDALADPESDMVRRLVS